MSEIGHNNPPTSDAFALHVDELFSTVSGSTASPVSNDEQEAALDELLDTVRQTTKDANAKRVEEKRPHDEAAKAVQAKWKPTLDRLDSAATAIKDALTPYRAAKQKAKDEAAAKARQEAEEARRAAQAELQKADDLEARFEAEAKLSQSSKLEAVANKIDRSATGLRTYKVAEVTDGRAALLWIAKNDKPAVDAFVTEYARTHAVTRPMDGVTVRDEKRAA